MKLSEKHKKSYIKKIGIINLGFLLMLITYRFLTDSVLPWLAIVNLLIFDGIYYGSYRYLSHKVQTKKFVHAYTATSLAKLLLILTSFAVFLKLFPELKYQNIASLFILYLIYTFVEVSWIKKMTKLSSEEPNS